MILRMPAGSSTDKRLVCIATRIGYQYDDGDNNMHIPPCLYKLAIMDIRWPDSSWRQSKNSSTLVLPVLLRRGGRATLGQFTC